MKWLALLAACGGGATGSTVDAADAVTFPLRILVTNSTVEVFTDGKDAACATPQVVFPAAGTCTTISDVQCGMPSCISDMEVYLDDRIIATSPSFLSFSPVTSGQLSLAIAGCGHGAIRIPLGDAASFPTATASATITDDAVHATWTTDRAEVLVSLSASVEGALCHAQGVSELATAVLAPQQVHQVVVEPLSAPTQLDTAFGPTTVWHATSVTAVIQ